MKRILLTAVAVVCALFAAGCSGSGSENYAYKGFVTEVYENARGETVIVTISDDVGSEFVIKPNTEMTGAPAKVPIDVGDYVQLTTTRTSDTDIKRMKIAPGYSTEGRLVYVEGDETPFLLRVGADGERMLVRLVDENSTLPGVSGMGDVIRVYHSTHIMLDDPTLAVEGLIFLENGTAEDITDEDKIFIVSQGYTVRE